ncbi:3,4-dihydroxy-2-butanone 4-phosphate synthase /GTP cyclohydrolase II [Ochrobactrum sp. J50]|jgi:3,4-dihydroxy 2-butanone 4-phosphate synthase/GTP cyclohydrolase II|uniref:3,4-dihydroxy-2-butanone 4-phosphate synthase n=1 Tax=Brucella pseudintermedia TaxID=370111 RepID=A0ABY5UCP9_9HYPH|nr:MULTISPECIES: 3,4-dihydroxy-2-butanone-4-phosphate synthase [Brucella/Ochrobactrum group]TWH02226.1 3,4-dihydroxy-2-butanone 4-phosphate synthase /GTP cyclohydrolase II [Ochrobactrum sp. J50]UWL60152.1 3,4-dihydroxy-2-butanone-4-phosphate synthase [Brucella pseudintermedia]WPM80573.1 3,4-dihydroxy-2-butanone-4-phosphate synthase [Brucella pseudintermedia]
MSYNQKQVVDALRAFERGEIVVVMDDDGRENEGDLIVAAVHCTPEKMAFIVRHTSGIVCTPMTREEAKRLNLAPMVAENESAHTTAFTVTVDYRHGTTTGISAEDRTLTVRNLANPNAGASDFVRPGHIFPLVAREGGVLMRSGHTEAAVDLCKLANLPPIGVICELVNDDGSVMRGPDVKAFAEKHALHRVTVADLIAYRQRKETLVKRVGDAPVKTCAGAAHAYTYELPWEPMQHVAVVFGDIRDGEEVPVRLHREDVLNDVFGKGGSNLDAIMEKMGKEGRGVLVYLREGSVGVRSDHHDTRTRDAIQSDHESHAEAVAREEEWRQIGLGAQILKDLGITSIVLLASRERHYVGLEGFGIDIARTEII